MLHILFYLLAYDFFAFSRHVHSYTANFTYLMVNILLSFLQERFYFGDNVLPLFETGIPLLKQRLQKFPDSEKVGGSPAELCPCSSNKIP